jgi:hypothetical protein
MKAILCLLPLLFAVGLRADEAQDRTAIANVIASLNDPAQRAGLFTQDSSSSVDFDRLIDLHRRVPSASALVIGTHETWTELTVPRVVSGTILFVTPDVAIVDGASTVEGAMTLTRRVPLLFVMKKEGDEWRISAVRVLAAREPAPAGVL